MQDWLAEVSLVSWMPLMLMVKMLMMTMVMLAMTTMMMVIMMVVVVCLSGGLLYRVGLVIALSARCTSCKLCHNIQLQHVPVRQQVPASSYDGESAVSKHSISACTGLAAHSVHRFWRLGVGSHGGAQMAVRLLRSGRAT